MRLQSSYWGIGAGVAATAAVTAGSPVISPAAAGIALAFLEGAVVVIRGRRRK